MFQYAGNNASFPTAIGIMDDSDTPNFTNLAMGFEPLADRTAWLFAHSIDGINGGTYTAAQLIFSTGTTFVLEGTTDLAGITNIAKVVTGVTVTNQGSGYSTPPAVSIQPPGGFGYGVTATGTAVINASGNVTNVIITNPGLGYTSVPSVSFSDGGGSNAAGTAAISQGKVEVWPTALMQYDNSATEVFLQGSNCTFSTGSTCTYASGSTCIFATGSTCVFQQGWSAPAGSLSNVSGELDIAGIFLGLAGSSIDIATGATLGIFTGANVQLGRGQDLKIYDGTNPVFAAARTVSIAQPFILVTYVTTFTGAINADSAADNSNGTRVVAWVSVVNLVNGATLTQISVYVTTNMAHIPTVDATISLYKRDNTNGAQTLVAQGNVTVLHSATTGIATLTLSDVIDTSRYSYNVQYGSEAGGGAHSITWYAPILQFSNITNLGQAQG